MIKSGSTDSSKYKCWKMMKTIMSHPKFENYSAQQFLKNTYCNPFQSSSLLAIRAFFCSCCVIEMFLHCFKRLFLYFTEFDGHFPCLNLAKIRDTVRLRTFNKEIIKMMCEMFQQYLQYKTSRKISLLW